MKTCPPSSWTSASSRCGTSASSSKRHVSPHQATVVPAPDFFCSFQAIGDNSARREQEVLAAQRRAQREEEAKKKANNMPGPGNGESMHCVFCLFLSVPCTYHTHVCGAYVHVLDGVQDGIVHTYDFRRQEGRLPVHSALMRMCAERYCQGEGPSRIWLGLRRPTTCKNAAPF